MSNIKNDSSKFFKGSIWWWTKPENNNKTKAYYDNLFTRDTMVVVVSNECLGQVTILPVYSPFSDDDIKDIESNPYIIFAHVNEKDCYIYCNKLFTIPTSRLRAFVGKLADTKLDTIESKLLNYFILSEEKEEVRSSSSVKEDIVDKHDSLIPMDLKSEVRNITLKKSSNNDKNKRKGRVGKPVYCDKTDTVYDSVDAASKILCISKSSIYRSINNGTTIGGMNFIRG